MMHKLTSTLIILTLILTGGVWAQTPAEAGGKALATGPALQKPNSQDVHYLDENGQIQRGIRCGTPTTSDAEKARVQARVEAFAPQLFLKSTTAIPIAFHVVHHASEGDVTTTQISDQIDVLNAAFAGTAFSFYLASVDYTENSSWFTKCHLTGWQKKMKKTLAIDPAHNLNLYTCKPGQGYFGWAYVPWSYPEDSYWHGIVAHFQTLPGGAMAPYNLGDTATHEVGHYLGLHHTFEGGGCGAPGDEVADTPAEATAAYGCPTGRDTCAGGGLDPITNFMDYTDDACMDEFTPGQNARMQTITATYRPSLGN